MPGDSGQYNEYGKHSLTGQDSINPEKVRNVRVEPDIRALRVANWIWDADEMEWIRDTGAAADLQDTEDILKGDWYHDERLEYSSGSIVYIGQHIMMNASVSGTGWLIQKVDYDGNNNINRTRVKTGSWEDRALGWS